MGVYPLDKLPPIMNEGGYIVNTQTSTLGGEHWLGIDVRPLQINVFDPLGIYYPDLLISRLARLHRRLICNTTMFQNPFEVTCGPHCLMWLHKRYS
jgi:hypothetical protein